MDIPMNKEPNHAANLAMVSPNNGRLEPLTANHNGRLDMMSPHPSMDLPRGELHPMSGPGTPGGSMQQMKPIGFQFHESPKRPHKCQTCTKAFPNTQQLTQHMLVHNNIRKYKCVFCDKAFKQLSHVQQHQRRHTGETPYKCRVEGCERAFAQMSNLQQHMRNHDNVKDAPDRKPYQCNVCARRFTTQTSLRNHMAKMHELGPTGINYNIDADKKFPCQICGKRFVRERGLMKHIEHAHTEGGRSSHAAMRLKVCTCPVCQKVFSRESYLLRHVQMKWDEGHRQELIKMERTHMVSMAGHYDNMSNNKDGGTPDQRKDSVSSSVNSHQRRTPDHNISPKLELGQHQDDCRGDSMNQSPEDSMRRYTDTPRSAAATPQLRTDLNPKELAMQLESFRAYAHQSTMPADALSLLQGHPSPMSPSTSYKQLKCVPDGRMHGLDPHHRNMMPYPRDHMEHMSPHADLSSPPPHPHAGMMSPNPKQMSSTHRQDYSREDNNVRCTSVDSYQPQTSTAMSMANLFRPEAFNQNSLLNTANGGGLAGVVDGGSSKMANMSSHIRAAAASAYGRPGVDNLQMSLSPSFNMWPRLSSPVCWPYQNQLPPSVPTSSGPVPTSADHQHDKYN